MKTATYTITVCVDKPWKEREVDRIITQTLPKVIKDTIFQDESEEGILSKECLVSKS